MVGERRQKEIFRITMNKTILVIICLLCVLAGAYGCRDKVPPLPLIVSTYVTTLNPQDEANIFSDEERNGPLVESSMELSVNEKITTLLAVPGGKIDGDPATLAYMQDIKTVEKLALSYINIVPYLWQHPRYIEAKAELKFSSDHKLAKYKLSLYYSSHSGKTETVTYRKVGDIWVKCAYGSSGGFRSNR